MDREIARLLLPFVNDPHFNESVRMYYEHRLAFLHKELEQADLSTISQIQGQIKELKQLNSLQARVREKAQ